MITIHSRHDQGIGAEIGADDLKELDDLADDVAAVELGEGEGPSELRQKGEESGQDVGDGEVQDEEVHPGHLRPSLGSITSFNVRILVKILKPRSFFKNSVMML